MGAVLAIWNDRDDAVAEEYERWYLTEHLPERLAVPGFLAARRYEALRGAPRFLTCYDVESPQVLASAAYLARLADPSPVTRRIMAHFRDMTRTVCTAVYRSKPAALGGAVAAAYVEQPAAFDRAALTRDAAACAADPRALSVQAWQAAPDAAHGATSEAKLRPGADRRVSAALVIDVMREADAAHFEARAADALRRCSGEARVHGGIYRLLGAWTKPP